MTQAQATDKLGNRGTQKGFRVHAIHAFHGLEGNLNQHVTDPRLAFWKQGPWGHVEEPGFLEFQLVISYPEARSTTRKCREDSSLFVIAFNIYLYLLHNQHRLRTRHPETRYCQISSVRDRNDTNPS